MDSVDWRDYVTFEPGKRSGQPCIRGMRITVYDVLEYLAVGMTVDQVLAGFPELTPEDNGWSISIRARCTSAMPACST